MELSNVLDDPYNPRRKQELGHRVPCFEMSFGKTSGCGKLLRAFTTTPIWKHFGGTRLIAVPNGNNVKDWTIRSAIIYIRLVGYDNHSEIGKTSVCNEGLTTLNMLKVRSAPLGNLWDFIGDEYAHAPECISRNRTKTSGGNPLSND